MSKDKNGFHPPKGKPSGLNKTEGLGTGSKFNKEISAKYTDGPDKLASNLHVLHPNRNVNKEESRRDREQVASKVVIKKFELAHEKSLLAEELPGIPTVKSFTDLANVQSDNCVSIYFSAHSPGSEPNGKHDLKTFKNILRNITQELKDRQVADDLITRMLAPGYEMLLDENIWRGLSPGFAVFIAEGFFRYMRMPVPVDEMVMVQHGFYLTPLIPLADNDVSFYILVLSKKQAKLFKADQFNIRYVPVEGMPEGIDDVVHFEEKEGKNLWRTGGRGGKGGANFHGTGSGLPDEKTNIAMYFDEVDETLMKEGLADKNVPLLLAGVDYMIPIFRSVSRYNHIWNESLHGNFEHAPSEEIHHLAMKVIQPYFEDSQNKAIDHYAKHSSGSLTSPIPADVIEAAHFGRVAQLFIRKNTHLWGTFDEAANKLEIHDTKHPDDVCLVNKAAIKTLLTGGEVFITDTGSMPADSPMAALMRY